MQVERGTWAGMPYAATGTGRPVVLLAGLGPTTGVDGDAAVRGALAPLRDLVGRRRLVVLNRRSHLPRGMTMAELAAEHADALRAGLDGPVDVVGVSTGGSIAQQLAADRPDVVRRLVLASTACRLPPHTRAVQAEVVALVRRDRPRAAVATLATDLVPGVLRPLARAAGWLLASRIAQAQGLADLATTAEAEDAFDLARCATVTAPTLVVGGGRDRFYPTGFFMETARLIPGSRLRVFSRRGHVTLLTDRACRAAIADFLGR